MACCFFMVLLWPKGQSGLNGNLFSKKAGRYSPSRLNITIGPGTLTA